MIDDIAPLTPELLARLEARGFDAEAFTGLDLGVGESRTQAGALAIPYYDGDAIVGMKIRGPQPGFPMVKQTSTDGVFYNINALRNPDLAAEPLIVIEGEPSTWAALVSGFPRAVGIPVAMAGRRMPYAEESELLWRDAREIVICTYAENVGNTLRENLAALFGRNRCKWVTYPKECRELAETIERYGVKGVQETIRRASWLPVPEIYSMAELPEPPENPAFDTGIVGLKEHFRVRRGDLCVVSGTPGAGKTSFVNEVTGRLAINHGWRTVFASFEQRPKPDHRRALRTFHGQKLEKNMGPPERAAADAWIEKHFRFLVPDEDTETSLDWLLETLGAAVRRFDPHIVVLDPWNELEHVRPQGMTQTEYTGVAIRALKRFAKANRVHMIVVAHPAKMQRDRDGKYPKPSLYDIADSAHWFNKPDAGILIWRESAEASTPTSIVVAKSRYHSEIGRPGAITGIWNESTGRYTISDDGSMQ